MDQLHGLKENVIVGRLIPAGTGAEVRRMRQIAQERDKEILASRNHETHNALEGESDQPQVES